MANLARLQQIQARFVQKATFLTVYTQEAHPTEGGDYMDYFHPVSQHRSIQDRIQAAGELLQLETLPGPLLVDNMKDEACKSYGSFPDRLYIILDGVVAFQGGVGPHGYLPKLVEAWLEKFYD